MVNLHENHRMRLKQRFIKENLDNFAEHNILELLLFYSIPQKDTNPVAHDLMKRFGSLSGVFDASYDELLKVKGVGSHTATLIKLMPAIFRCYEQDKQDENKILDTTVKLGEYLKPKFIGRSNEIMLLLCFDQKNRLLCCEMLAEGTIDSTPVTIRHIIEVVMRVKAYSVVISHNHPQSWAIPSYQDIQVTKSIKEKLSLLKVHLRDHIIVAGGDFVSMADSGMLIDE